MKRSVFPRKLKKQMIIEYGRNFYKLQVWLEKLYNLGTHIRHL